MPPRQARGQPLHPIYALHEEARGIRGVIPGPPIPAAPFEDIIATCLDLDRQDRADTLTHLTLKKP